MNLFSRIARNKRYIVGELTNKEVCYQVQKNCALLREYLCGTVILPTRDMYAGCLSELGNFMLWYMKSGYAEKSVGYYLGYDSLREIGEVSSRASQLLKYSEIGTVCVKYLKFVDEIFSISSLVEECIRYIGESLVNRGFRVYISRSASSRSIYLQPDGSLGILRVSDHVNPGYMGQYSVVCCKVAPLDACSSVYVDSTNYKSVLNNIVDDYCKKRSSIIKNSSKSGYKKYVSNALKTLKGYTLFR